MDKNEIIRQLSVALPIYKEMEEYDKKVKNLEKRKKAPDDVALSIFLTFCITAVVVVGILFLCFGLTPTTIVMSVILTIVITVIIGLGPIKAGEKKKQEKINQMLEERKQFVQNRFCVELLVLPPDYRYALACSCILSCFQNMRADTMKEAVNLYVEQLDRWKQESLLKNMQNQMAQIQREQASSNAFFETAVFIGLMRE